MFQAQETAQFRNQEQAQAAAQRASGHAQLHRPLADAEREAAVRMLGQLACALQRDLGDPSPDVARRALA